MTPGAKYFKGRLYDGSGMCPWVVWDGVRAYENEPPPSLLVAEKLIAQIRSLRAGSETITTLLKNSDGVVLWARDHRTYRAIVENIQRQSDGWLS